MKSCKEHKFFQLKANNGVEQLTSDGKCYIFICEKCLKHDIILKRDIFQEVIK